MIDVERIKTRIGIIRENIMELEAMKGISLEDLSRQKRDLAAAKHFIRVAIEAMIDIGSHIVAKERFGSPSTNREIMILLAEKGIISKEDLPTYIRMVKYRNRLVHFYHEVSVPEIYNIIQDRLSDFAIFIRDILNYVEKRNEGLI